MNFLNHHNKLSSHQHGFHTAHSCQTQLLESVHHWAQSLDKRSSTHIFFLDFSKAFDSVPHERLLIKLDCIGVRGAVLKWIRSFLTDRRQRVMLEGCTSTWAPVTSGVPQGSILGPLLFLVYINDIDTQLNSHVKLFADDCAIYNQVSCKADTSSLQSDLNSLYTWCVKWQLNLNLHKSGADLGGIRWVRMNLFADSLDLLVLCYSQQCSTLSAGMPVQFGYCIIFSVQYKSTCRACSEVICSCSIFLRVELASA